MKRLVLFVLCPLLLAFHAQAAFVYSGLQNIPIPTDFDGVYIDLDNGSTAFADFAGADINPFFGGSGFFNNAAFQPVRTGTNYDDAILRLPSGTLISAASTFSSGAGVSGSPNSHMGTGTNLFFPGTEGFLGFMFNKNDSSGPFYGWIRVVFTNNTAGGLIKDWVYDDSGAPILAGAPEPAKSLFLLMGLAALIQRRKRMC
jgi:hypothetical protein